SHPSRTRLDSIRSATRISPYPGPHRGHVSMSVNRMFIPAPIVHEPTTGRPARHARQRSNVPRNAREIPGPRRGRLRLPPPPTPVARSDSADDRLPDRRYRPRGAPPARNEPAPNGPGTFPRMQETAPPASRRPCPGVRLRPPSDLRRDRPAAPATRRNHPRPRKLPASDGYAGAKNASPLRRTTPRVPGSGRMAGVTGNPRPRHRHRDGLTFDGPLRGHRRNEGPATTGPCQSRLGMPIPRPSPRAGPGASTATPAAPPPRPGPRDQLRRTASAPSTAPTAWASPKPA